MAPFDDIATTGPIRIWDGVLARTVEGAQLSLAVVELDPGSDVREHAHENEQLGLVVSGSVRSASATRPASSAPVKAGGSRRTCPMRFMPAPTVQS